MAGPERSEAPFDAGAFTQLSGSSATAAGGRLDAEETLVKRLVEGR